MTNLILLSVLSLLQADPQPATTSAPAPVLAASPVAQPAVAQVTLRVTVRKDGQPFAGVPLGAMVGLRGVDPRDIESYAVTNEFGVAEMPVTLRGENICRLSVAPRWPASAGPVPAALVDQASRDALTGPWTWAQPYVMQLSANTAVREVEINVYPKRSVTMPIRIGTSAAHFAIAHVGWRPPGAAHDSTINGGGRTGGQDIQGVIELPNVPQGSASFAFIAAGIDRSGKSLFFHRVEIPAGLPNAVLPQMVVDPVAGPTGTAEFTVSNLNATPFSIISSSLAGGLSFYSADGSKVVSDSLPNPPAFPHTVKLPVGTWYVAAGIFSLREPELRLIERLRAGEDLTNTPIPKIVITEGATVAVNADAAAIERAIIGFPEPAPASAPQPPLPVTVPLAARTITVDVLVERAGLPMAEVPLTCSFDAAKGMTQSVTVTGANGHAVMSVVAAGSTGRLTVRVDGGLIDFMNSLFSNNTFRDGYPLTLNESTNQYSLTIAVEPAIKATLRLAPITHPSPGPSASLERAGAFGQGRLTGVGEVTVGGLKRGAPNVLTITKVHEVGDFGFTYIVRHRVPAAQEDIDLGAVPFAVPTADVTGELVVQRPPDVIEPTRDRFNGLTLVSPDGLRLVTFGLQPKKRLNDGSLKYPPGSPITQSVRFPAGTWYVMPGLSMDRPWQMRLIERCESGEDLSTSGIPRITVAAGASVVIDMNPAAVERAIMGIPEPAPVVPAAPLAPLPTNPGG